MIERFNKHTEHSQPFSDWFAWYAIDIGIYLSHYDGLLHLMMVFIAKNENDFQDSYP